MSLALALQLARANPVENLPRMAAVIRGRKGYIHGTGQNSRKSDPLAAKYGRHPEAIFLHAELAAIKDALKEISSDELANCTLYVARVGKNNEPRMAKPCVGCQRAILEFGLGQVEWTVSEVGEVPA